MSTTMTRRSFMKTAAVTGAVGALGLGAAHNMKPSDKAWADNDVHEVRTSCPRMHRELRRHRHGQQRARYQAAGRFHRPMSKGRMCPKGPIRHQALYHPNRNKYPHEARGRQAWQPVGAHQLGQAAKTVAQHMIDMRDKTGKHGLLCTTGGGGNPAVLQPAALPATSGARATCSSLVARSATCRVTSPCRWSTASATSIADSGCSELYKPAKYGGLTEVYVIWGTGPAWHSPSTSGRCVAELRNGCKTVVVDPRFTADASKADVAAHQARHRHGHDARLDALHHREQAVRRSRLRDVLRAVDEPAVLG